MIFTALSFYGLFTAYLLYGEVMSVTLCKVTKNLCVTNFIGSSFIKTCPLTGF